MQNKLPENLEKYSETPLFTQDAVPAALLQDHQTKPQVWGMIVVVSGALAYRRPGQEEQRVCAGHPALIHPQETHSVAPLGDVSFRVEFYRAARKEQAQ